MIHLKRGNLLYWLATVGGYVEDARTENLFSFSYRILAGIVVLLLRFIGVMIVLYPLALTAYWVGTIIYNGSYVEPSYTIIFGWILYASLCAAYIVTVPLEGCMVPSQKLPYRMWRKFNKFVFRIKTSNLFKISFINRGKNDKENCNNYDT